MQGPGQPGLTAWMRSIEPALSRSLSTTRNPADLTTCLTRAGSPGGVGLARVVQSQGYNWVNGRPGKKPAPASANTPTRRHDM